MRLLSVLKGVFIVGLFVVLAMSLMDVGYADHRPVYEGACSDHVQEYYPGIRYVESKKCVARESCTPFMQQIGECIPGVGDGTIIRRCVNYTYQLDSQGRCQSTQEWVQVGVHPGGSLIADLCVTRPKSMETCTGTTNACSYSQRAVYNFCPTTGGDTTTPSSHGAACPAHSHAGYPQIQQGSKSVYVEYLVSDLKQLGRGEDLSSESQTFGPKTKAAVQDYQRSKGLTPDGIVGPQTWGALASDINNTCENNSSVDIKVRPAGSSDPFSDGPIAIPYDTHAELSWSSSNTVSCSTSTDGDGKPATSWDGKNAIKDTGALKVDNTYTITCDDTDGKTVTDNVTIDVADPPLDPPTVDITASLNPVDSGDSTVLSWSVAGADSCNALNEDGQTNWQGSKNKNGGSQSVTPEYPSTRYRLACSNDGGTAEDSVTVTVNAGSVQLIVGTRKASNGCYDVDWSASRVLDTCVPSSDPEDGAWNNPAQFILDEDGNGSGTVENVACEVTTTITLTCGGAFDSARLVQPFIREINPGGSSYNIFDFFRNLLPGLAPRAFAG